MKRLFALLLAVILAFSCVGCGGAPSGGEVAPAESQSSPVDTGSVESAPEADANLTLGRMEGGIYTNEYMGIRCELGSDWTFYSAAELQELPQAVLEATDGTELGEQLANNPNIFVMKAENVELLQDISINYVKMTMAERLAAPTMTDDDVFDTLMAQKDQMIATFEQIGMTDITFEQIPVTYLGEERKAMLTSGIIQGTTPYYGLQIMEYDCGSHLVTIGFTSYVENTTLSMLELFQPIG